MSRNQHSGFPVAARRSACATGGFTLLEVLVATLIMGIAVVTLMGGISRSMHNAARLTAYDRVALLARGKMDELLVDDRLPMDAVVEGSYDASSGWRAKIAPFEMPPNPGPTTPYLESIQLEIWWMAGEERRTFRTTAYRRNTAR